MATLEEALNYDRSKLEPAPQKPTTDKIPSFGLEPGYNSYIRTTLPPINATPDTLRNYYRGGQVPQRRIFPPAALTSGTGGGGSNTTVVQQTIRPSPNVPTNISKSASITTNVLNPNDIFQGSLLMSKAFTLLTVTADSAVRIELYGNLNSQNLDISRGLDVPPDAGTTQNIIMDLVLDSSPFMWQTQGVIGVNADSPQSVLIYITITNVGEASLPVTVTFTFVPTES